MAKIPGALITRLKYIHIITCPVYHNHMDYLVGSTVTAFKHISSLEGEYINEQARCTTRQQ